MKRFTLWLIRQFADNREFRINVCKELHKNAQNYFGEQTGYGRYYEACGEFFEAAPEYTVNYSFDTKGGVMAQFEETRKRLSLLPQTELVKMLSDFYGKEYTNASISEQERLIGNYRKVEEENLLQIEKAGGIRAWYESGQGRLMEFGTSDSNGI